MNGAKIANDVSRIRERIAAKKDEIDNLEQVKVPRAQADAAVDNLITFHAERARLGVGYLADGLQMPHPGDRDAFSMFCWMAPDVVRKRFLDELDRHYDGAVVMDSASVSRTRSKLESELFELEVEEERLIASAEERGVRINRRGDADPRAILEA